MLLPRSSQSTEVVVLGAGVAGLLIASRLAADHKVVVLERRPRLPTEKYWLTDCESLRRHPDLEPAVERHYESLDFISATHASFRAAGEYILWNTQSLLELLVNRINERGGQILFNARVYSYRLEAGSIKILFNDSAITAKLAIDCTGYQSPIAYSSGAVRVAGYYILYGSTFPLLEPLDPIGLHNLMMDRKPLYVEAFPTNDGKVHLVLIGTSGAPDAVYSLRDSFSFVLNQSPYRGLIDGGAPEQRSFLGGIIPVGELSRRSLDRIFFFGESGQFNPPASATALTALLHSYEEIGLELANLLRTDDLKEADLASVRHQGLDPFNRRLQLGLFRSIMNWSSHDFDEVIRGLVRGSQNRLVNDLLFGRSSSRLRDRLDVLRDLLRHREQVLLKALLRGLLGV